MTILASRGFHCFGYPEGAVMAAIKSSSSAVFDCVHPGCKDV